MRERKPCSGNHDRAAAGRKGAANSPWRRGHVSTPRARACRKAYAEAQQKSTAQDPSRTND